MPNPYPSPAEHKRGEDSFAWLDTELRSKKWGKILLSFWAPDIQPPKAETQPNGTPRLVPVTGSVERVWRDDARRTPFVRFSYLEFDESNQAVAGLLAVAMARTTHDIGKTLAAVNDELAMPIELGLVREGLYQDHEVDYNLQFLDITGIRFMQETARDEVER